MKKLLFIGGKPIGTTEMVKSANAMGIYTIVTDYLSEEQSPAKKVAAEQWDVSAADADVIARKAKENHVNGITAGVHEFCLRKGLEAAAAAGIEAFCTIEQWDACSNKKNFKKYCTDHGIPVAKVYRRNDNDIDYPVIVKPTDSDGSRGFSICNNDDELKVGIKRALEYSNDYLIEEYLPCDACIIHYTAIDGEIYFSGISDKYSRRLPGGSMVMALQLFPSKDWKRYLEDVNENAVKMFKDLKIKNGPIWIEAFNDGKRFIFNEMALRFGGSMTNYPVEYYTGIDQMRLMINASLNKKAQYNIKDIDYNKKYAIVPIHVKSGEIADISGVEELQAYDWINAFVPVHHKGDVIQSWGTAQQVFCYLHIIFSDVNELKKHIQDVKNTLHVTDTERNEQLFYLMNIDEINL